MSSQVTNAQIAVRFGISFTIIAVVLFGSAGTIFWPEAWLYIFVHLGCAFFMTAWMKLHDPSLLKKRTELNIAAAESWDRKLLLLMIILFIPYLIILGLDAVRFGWSDVPLEAQIGAMALLSGSLWITFRAMQENSFASPIVELQADRGHKVIDTGPYAHVRHPMYSGVILFLFALPVWLGSLWGLPMAAVISAVFLFRIFAEERLLRVNLDGYKAYTERVRYRLFPKLW